MRYISHRGNINGKANDKENHPEYILNAYLKGFDVEIDVWLVDGKIMLGHDKPQYLSDENFLNNSGFWLHAKNSSALHFLLKNIKMANVFWHQEDCFTITSKGVIWTYPNNALFDNSVCVLPELGYKGILQNCYGVCSDFVSNIKDENS